MNAASSACVFCSPGVCVLYWCQEPCFDHVRNFKQQLFLDSHAKELEPAMKELPEKDNVCLWKMRRARVQHYYPCKIGFEIYRFASQGPFKDKADMTDSYSSSLNAECYSLALSDETGFSSSCCLIEMQRRFRALVLEV